MKAVESVLWHCQKLEKKINCKKSMSIIFYKCVNFTGASVPIKNENDTKSLLTGFSTENFQLKNQQDARRPARYLAPPPDRQRHKLGAQE